MKALRLSVIAVFAMGCLAAQTPKAADPDPHEADRKQLLALFAEVEAAINDQNIDRMLAQMDDHVTVVWLNAEVSRGKPEVKAYYGRMVGTPQAILKKYLTKAKVGAPAQFYGDVAVADGSAADSSIPMRAASSSSIRGGRPPSPRIPESGRSSHCIFRRTCSTTRCSTRSRPTSSPREAEGSSPD